MSNDILTQIAELEARIAAFPIGSFGQKQVNGKTYYYHRFREDGKRKERYIPESEVAALRAQIDQRKAVEKQLKDLKKLAPKKKAATKTHDYITDVRIGDRILIADGAAGLNDRGDARLVRGFYAVGEREERI